MEKRYDLEERTEEFAKAVLILYKKTHQKRRKY